MKKLIEALLKDENGISEEAFNALYDFVEDMGNTDQRDHLLAILKCADATDGRFYLKD